MITQRQLASMIAIVFQRKTQTRAYPAVKVNYIFLIHKIFVFFITKFPISPKFPKFPKH